MRSAPDRAPRLARGLLAVLVLLGIASSARAQDIDHPMVAPDPRAPAGPLVSAVRPDGFTLNAGSRDGAPRAARLLIFDGAARPAPDTPPLRLYESQPAAWHLVTATGLLPAHRYRYRLILEDHPDFDGEVSTAPAPDSLAPVLLAVFGDERGADEGVAPGAAALIRAVLAEAPDLVVGTGDLVNEGGRPEGWQALLRNHGPLFAQIPYYPALGNHELVGDPAGEAWRRLFPTAAAGHYAVRYGPVLMIFLDGNHPGDATQARFLDAELGRAAADPGVRARLIVMHQPPLSASLHCGSGHYMSRWVEIWERHHVDAVIAGHDHAYQRLERNGVAYFISGGGGAPLYPRGSCGDPDEPALQRYEAAHHFLLMRIAPRPSGRAEITVRARAPGGPILDEVTLPLPAAQVLPFEPQELAPGQRPVRRLHRGYLRYVADRYGRLLLLFGASLLVSLIAWRVARRR